MGRDGFTPRADMVDGEFFIETAQTARATAGLWALLRVSRQEPRPWLPLTVLCGEHGTGKSAVARRFGHAARREVACDLLTKGPANRVWADPARGSPWEEAMVRRHGRCLEMCQPAAWVSGSVVDQALRDTAMTHPTINVSMVTRPDRHGGTMGSPAWGSPGNVAGHPTRRTSVCFVDDADRLLTVAPSRRRDALEQLLDYPKRVVRHAVSTVLIGSPEMAEVVAACLSTQVIRVDAMEDDPAFATVVAMLFGTRVPAEVADLHRASGGLMGRLVHIARMQGLTPPYHVLPEEILTLAALPAPDPRNR